MIDRRAFVAGIAGALLATPRAAEAQPLTATRRIAFMGNTSISDPDSARLNEAFRQALQERGYQDGRNLVIDARYADGREERFPALAAELIRLKPDVIVTTSGAATEAAKAATSTIPIVIAGVSNPVERGLVQSLAHPGGMITGVTNLQVDLISKRVELLKSAVPKAARIVIVSNASGWEPAKRDALRKQQDADAKAIGVTTARIELNTPSEWRSVTEAVVRERPDALLLAPTPINFQLRREIAEFATVQRLPTSGSIREQAVAGFLMTLGPDNAEVLRHAAVYVDKILKGAKPGDLAIEQPTEFKFVINLKTAKALGIAIPQSLLLRADEVIR